MARRRLTELVVGNLKARGAGRQVTVWDTSCPGFGVRVNERSKSWTVMFGRERRCKTFGRYPDMSLADARRQAKQILLESGAVRFRAPPQTFELAVARFLSTRPHNRPRTIASYRRLLMKHFFPSLRSQLLENISTQQVLAIVDRLTPTPAERAHAFVVIKMFFRWAARRRLIDRSPCEDLPVPVARGSRDRVLNDAELVAVYRAAQADGYPFGMIVHLLILTGQRRGEIAGLRWSYVDREKRIITLPASVTKNRRAHSFPFGHRAAEILATAPKLGDYVFPARGSDAPFSGFSACTARLNKASGVTDWTPHDLRRTFATNLAALGVPPHVTERLLNHVSGTISGVAAIYNRFQYVDEMRAAVAAYEARLGELLADGEGLTVSSPFHLDGETKVAPRRAPSVGQHTVEMLREAGYTTEDIGQLRALGVLG